MGISLQYLATGSACAKKLTMCLLCKFSTPNKNRCDCWVDFNDFLHVNMLYIQDTKQEPVIFS